MHFDDLLVVWDLTRIPAIRCARVFHKLRELARTDLHIILDLRRDEEVNADPQHKYESQRYDHFDCLAQN